MLTLRQIQTAKPKDKNYKLYDSDGLFLLVTSAGGKYWRYRYKINQKEKQLSIGAFPQISLQDARFARNDAKKHVVKGIDPVYLKAVEKLTNHINAENSFEALAREWHGFYMRDKSKDHADRAMHILENDLFPYIGEFPIENIKAIELLAALRNIENRSIDLAHRARQTAGQVFRYAIQTGRASLNPAKDLEGALRKKNTEHRAAIIDPAELGKLLVNMDYSKSSLVVKTAMLLSPMLFQRPGEIRQMEWSEINWEKRIWEIPANKMKMRNDHVVPLAKQALELLTRIQSLTGRGQYVFPSPRTNTRCISDNAVRTALRDLGYTNEQVTPHGFRATARTLLDEVLKYRVDFIEAQLAHSVRDATGRAYNRTSFLSERAEMMQAWADYLDEIKQACLNRITNQAI